MGATLVMAASLAIVICLILVLLVKLYCSLLLCRHQLEDSTTASSTTITIPTDTTTAPFSPQDIQNKINQSPYQCLCTRGPSCTKQLPTPLQTTQCYIPHQIGILHPTSPSIYFVTSQSDPVREKACSTAPGSCVKNLVYISNPIYDNNAGTGRPEITPSTLPSSDDGYLLRLVLLGYGVFLRFKKWMSLPRATNTDDHH
ncbi:hypothetical protein HRI_003150100 [Hibiscus trionum]|uniref:Uncharacterized protein n=1 Tax=Hibiscus trionum TaxID=183268 RepID=A0A9W7IIF9_HIBTR|nr:hypothetical protein HRI_003150100 [Hibiscus trionum]